MHLGDGSLGVPGARSLRRDHRRGGGARAPARALRAAGAGRPARHPGRRPPRPAPQVVVSSPEGPAVARSVPCRFVPLVGAEGSSFQARGASSAARVIGPARRRATCAFGAGGVEPAPTAVEPRSTFAGRRSPARPRAGAPTLLGRASPTRELGPAREVLRGRRLRLRRQPRRLRDPRSRSDVHYLLAAVCSFLVAVTNNYMWNRAWTFRHQRGHLVFQGFRFLLVSTVALGANLAFLSAPRRPRLPKLPAQAIAIALVTPWNFVANKLWSFRRRHASWRAGCRARRRARARRHGARGGPDLARLRRATAT